MTLAAEAVRDSQAAISQIMDRENLSHDDAADVYIRQVAATLKNKPLLSVLQIIQDAKMKTEISEELKRGMDPLSQQVIDREQN